MKTVAVVLCVLQFLATTTMAVAVVIDIESIIVTGPLLTIFGLLLAAATRCVQSRLVLMQALSGPLMCIAFAIVIPVLHLGPRQAQLPIGATVVVYALANLYFSACSLAIIRRYPAESFSRPSFVWKFSLKSMLIVMAALSVLFAAGRLLTQLFPHGEWIIFGGYALVCTPLVAAILWRYHAGPGVQGDGSRLGRVALPNWLRTIKSTLRSSRMNFKSAVRTQFNVADFMVDRYLSDLSDTELLARPAPDANHVAWQLGHLISAETRLVEAAMPGSMPALPPGFAERHSKDTAGSDNPSDFLTKAEYMDLAKSVRAAALVALDRSTDADLDKAVSGRVPPWVKCGGDCFVTAAGHWVLHAGQWVILRRKLGRERQF